MPTFLNQQINPPEHWQEFEKLCRDLWARIWNDPNTQRNGRSGQSQQGVDVFGRLGGDGDWQGVQCKGKNTLYGAAVTNAELKAEVKKAKKFKPSIKGFILVTSAPNDSSIQETARQLTEKHKAKGLFSVDVLGWEEILTRLSDYPELIDKYYPDQGPTQHRIDQKLDDAIERQLSIEASQLQLSPNIAKAIIQELQANGAMLTLPDGAVDPEDKALNLEIDSYRDRIESVPRTALSLLQDLRERSWDKASKQTRFRIVTNIGSAYLALGDLQNAAEHFSEAIQYAADDDDKAARNLAYSYLIRDDFEQAYRKAEQAISLNPDEADGYAILVAARGISDDVNAPEDLVPKKHLSKTTVIYSIGHAYRRRGDSKKALEWFKRAYKFEPESKHYRVSYGSALLGRVVDKSGAILKEYFNEGDIKDLEQGADLLQTVWDDTKGTELSESFSWIGINLCTALSALNRNDELKALIPEVVGLVPDAPELRKLAAIFELNADNPDAALEHLSDVPQGLDSELDLLRVEILAETSRFEEALRAVEAIEFPEDKKIQRSVARGLRIRLLAKVKGADTAIDAAKKAEKEHPDDPLLFVSLAQLFAGLKDDAAAKEMASRAHSVLNTSSAPSERFAVADILYGFELFTDALGLYQSLLQNYGDSQLLRRLLICQYETDQRKNALDTLEKLSPATRSLKFYRRYATAIYIRSGEPEKALEEAEIYLTEVPTDLEMRLNWIGLHQRLRSDQPIRDFLRSAPDYPAETPGNQIQLAHLFSHYGYPERGLHLTYQLRREHQDVPAVHLGYVALFLEGQLPTDGIHVSNVEENTAFVLEDAKGRRQSFLIEEQWTDKLYPEEIPLTHPIAQEAMGKSVGDTVAVTTNPFQTQESKIVDLKSKYLFVLHDTMAAFSSRFPNEGGLWTVDVGATNGDGYDFTPVFKALDDRQSHVLRVEELYNTGTYPIGFIATLLGVHPLAVWSGFMQSADRRILCCVGNHDEREAAFKLVEKNKNGFIIDPLTLFSVVALGVHEELTKTFGRLGVTQSCLDMYSIYVQQERLLPTTKTMGKIGDQYTIQELTEEQAKEELRKYEKVLEWAEKNCDVYPAVGARDVDPRWVDIYDHIDHAFTDTILAASGSDKLILSDDQHLRTLAMEMMEVEGVWLQILLIKAVKQKTFPVDLYNEVTANLVEAGIDFTTIDSGVLFRIAEKEGWNPSENFKVVASSLGSVTAELRSSVLVAAEFLIKLWNSQAPIKSRRKLTGVLIDALTVNHDAATPAMLRVLMKFGRKLEKKQQRPYISTIRKWCADHSIPLQIFESERLRQLKLLLKSTTSLTK